MKCEYKEFCDGEGNATQQCEDCKMKYCDECAETMDYECDCIVYRNIHPMKKSELSDKEAYEQGEAEDFR